jgi:hypothetical protein
MSCEKEGRLLVISTEEDGLPGICEEDMLPGIREEDWFPGISKEEDRHTGI